MTSSAAQEQTPLAPSSTTTQPAPSNYSSFVQARCSDSNNPLSCLPRKAHPPNFHRQQPLPASAGRIEELRRTSNAPGMTVEPKVFFAHERTFLAWTHTSITLAGASVALAAFSTEKGTPWSEVYSLFLLPVAICFVGYAIYQYLRRSAMILRRHPGPYDDEYGPPIFAVMVIVGLLLSAAVKISTWRQENQ